MHRPFVLRRLGRVDLDRVDLAHMLQGTRDPLDVLVDREDHVGENAGAAGAGDREQVREARDHQAEVGVRPILPRLLERQSVLAGNVHRQ